MTVIFGAGAVRVFSHAAQVCAGFLKRPQQEGFGRHTFGQSCGGQGLGGGRTGWPRPVDTPSTIARQESTVLVRCCTAVTLVQLRRGTCVTFVPDSLISIGKLHGPAGPNLTPGPGGLACQVGDPSNEVYAERPARTELVSIANPERDFNPIPGPSGVAAAVPSKSGAAQLRAARRRARSRFASSNLKHLPRPKERHLQ